MSKHPPATSSSDTPPVSSGRRWALRALAGAAGLGGLYLGIRTAPQAPAPAGSAPSAALPPAGAASLPAAETELWAASFERPEGGELRLADFRGQKLLINFWATWCPPCVKELPELAEFQREFKAQGWQVVGLAVDAPTPVRAFLQKLPLDFPQGLAGLTGTQLARTLGNSQGGLPFSVALGADGLIQWRKTGATSLTELREMAASPAAKR